MALKNDWLQYFGRFALILIVSSGVLVYDFRVTGIYDAHLKYTLDDLPRNYLWFSIEIITTILVIITLTIFIFSNFQEALNRAANQQANSVIRNVYVDYNPIFALILAFSILITIFLYSSLTRVRSNLYSPVKLRLGSEFLKG